MTTDTLYDTSRYSLLASYIICPHEEVLPDVTQLMPTDEQVPF